MYRRKEEDPGSAVRYLKVGPAGLDTTANPIERGNEQLGGQATSFQDTVCTAGPLLSPHPRTTLIPRFLIMPCRKINAGIIIARVIQHQTARYTLRHVRSYTGKHTRCKKQASRLHEKNYLPPDLPATPFQVDVPQERGTEHTVAIAQ